MRRVSRLRRDMADKRSIGDEYSCGGNVCGCEILYLERIETPKVIYTGNFLSIVTDL